MVKKTLLLGVGTAITAATAGTFVGLYAWEHGKNHSKTKAQIMADIVARLNAIPQTHGLLTVEDYEDDVVTKIQDASNHIHNIHQATAEILKDKIEESKTQTNTYIDKSLTAHKDLFKNEIQKHADELESAMITISGGIVGDHDLNYYRDVLEDTVDESQFKELNNAVDAIDDDLNNRINTLVGDIDQNKKDITSLDTKLAAATATTGTKIDATNAALDALKTELDTLAGPTLKGLTDEIKRNINAVKNSLVSTDKNVETLKSRLTLVDEMISKNRTNVQDLKVMYNLVIEKTNEHDIALEDLSETISRVKNVADTNGASIIDLTTKVKALQTADQEMKTELIEMSKINDNLVERVEKNEDDINKLFNEVKNTTTTINDHIKDAEKTMLNLNSKIDDAIKDVEVTHTAFRSSIALNETNLTKLTEELKEVKKEVDGIKTTVDANVTAIADFENGINVINNTVADIFNDLDDLTKVVNANEAKTLGLEDRVALLENNKASASTETLYHSAAGNVGVSLRNWFNLPSNINNFSKLSFIYYDAHSGRPGTWDMNLDYHQRFTLIGSGDRSHPNRSWFNIFIDYANSRIRTYNYWTAGNASWTWHYNENGLKLIQVVGTKK